MSSQKTGLRDQIDYLSHDLIVMSLNLERFLRLMKKILIILADKLDKHCERVSGAIYLKNFFNIEFVICKSWIWNLDNKEIDLYYSQTDTLYKYSLCKEYKELEGIIKKSNSDYIFDLTNNDFSEKIQSIAKKLNLKYVLIRNGHLSASYITRIFLVLKRLKYYLRKKVDQNKNILPENISSEIIKKKKVYYLKSFFIKIFKKFRYETQNLKPDVALIAGTEVLKIFDKKTKDIIHIGSNDYYIYRENTKKIVNQKKYILFIDTLLVDEPEKQFQENLDPLFSFIEFKKFHEIVFKKFEEKYNLPVVISGHRRGQVIDGYDDLFSGRKVIYHDTENLVKNCEFVIGSFSTAISFAVLDYKPIFFYTNYNMDISPWGPMLYQRAKDLGTYVVDFENKIQLPSEYDIIDKVKYNSFIKKYLYSKSSTENYPFEEFIKKYA
tara:strand:- start:67 stop:1380 length:1314 start_codon:yes stop_codon:yes gene_type:complete